MLNYCGFGPEIVEYAAEKAPLKIGLYTPGTHIPVISQEEAFRDRLPDDFLMLAWNFLDEILATTTDFQARGGRFIVPVPHPHVL